MKFKWINGVFLSLMLCAVLNSTRLAFLENWSMSIINIFIASIFGGLTFKEWK